MTEQPRAFLHLRRPNQTTGVFLGMYFQDSLIPPPPPSFSFSTARYVFLPPRSLCMHAYTYACVLHAFKKVGFGLWCGV